MLVGGRVWSLRMAGAIGVAAAQVPELVNLLLAVGYPSLPCETSFKNNTQKSEIWHRGES